MKRIKQIAKTASSTSKISVESQQRFSTRLSATKQNPKPSRRFSIYPVSAKDKIDPGIIQRIDAKLDHALEILDSLT